MTKKVALFIVALTCILWANEKDALNFATKTELTNPYSKALGQRIAGYALAGEGALSLVVGLILDNNNIVENMYADLGESI